MGQEEHEMSTDEFAELRKQVQDIHNALLGSFENEGIVSRINKLESKVATFQKAILGAGVAIGGLLLDAVKGLF